MRIKIHNSVKHWKTGTDTKILIICKSVYTLPALCLYFMSPTSYLCSSRAHLFSFSPCLSIYCTTGIKLPFLSNHLINQIKLKQLYSHSYLSRSLPSLCQHL